MALKYLKAFDLGTIAAGASAEGAWTPSEDVHIHKIYIVERTAQPLNNVDAYLKFGDSVVTKDFAPASIFGQDPLVSIQVDRDVPKGAEIYWRLTNNSSASLSIVIVFEITEQPEM